MATMQIPRTSFIPHPEGQHEGEIILVEDLGMKETAFGEKHKIAVRIESITAKMDDGQPFLVQQWFTVSGHEKSSLRKFRELVGGRKLSNDEAYNFDPDRELVGKKVGFVIVHNEGREGAVFANIQAIWPLKNGVNGGPPPAAPQAPTFPATKAAPEQIARCARVLVLMVEKGLYKEADAQKATDWSETATAEALETFVEQSIKALKAHGVTIPEGIEAPLAAPAPPAVPGVPGDGGKDDALPF